MVIKIDLIHKESKYHVENSNRTTTTIKYAIKGIGLKEFLNVINHTEEQLNKFMNTWIPIYIIEAACKINKRDNLIPINYQEFWFCLNNITLKKEFRSGRIMRSKLKFSPVYLDNEKAYNLIKEAMKRIGGRKKFGELCNVGRGTYNLWFNKNVKVPITALIKACDLLKKDLWHEIDGFRIYNKFDKYSVLFSNKISPELRDIIIWVKEEGNLGLSGCVQLYQKDKAILEKLKGLIIKTFEIPKSQLRIFKKGRIHCLHVYSHAIRQILCLRFKIPIGNKSKISINESYGQVINYEDKIRVIAKLIETEGSLTYSNKKYDFLQPKFYFGISNKSTIKFYNNLLTELGYTFYTNNRKRLTGTSYETSVCSLNHSAKLCYQIFPYFYHKEKIKSAIKILSQQSYIIRLRLTNNKNMKNLIYKAYDICSRDNRRQHVLNLTKLISNLGKRYNFTIRKSNIFDWLRNDERETNPPLIAVLLLCRLTREDFFKYVPRELAFLLYIHNFIDYKNLVNLRSMEFGDVLEVMNEK